MEGGRVLRCGIGICAMLWHLLPGIHPGYRRTFSAPGPQPAAPGAFQARGAVGLLAHDYLLPVFGMAVKPGGYGADSALWDAMRRHETAAKKFYFIGFPLRFS